MNPNTISVSTGHEDMIHDVQLDYYGKLLATCSSDKKIRIFSIEDGVATQTTEIDDHKGPVWRIAWCHPKFGSLLASCSYDGTVKIFSITKDKPSDCLYVYSNHKSSVNAVAWAPHEYGLCLMAASSDGTISCHYKENEGEWKSQQISVCSQGCSSLSWCPFRASSDGTNILRVAVGAGDNNIHIIKCTNSPTNAWEEEMKLRGHTDRIRDVSWCPFVGFASNVIASCGRDNKLCIWTQHPNELWDRPRVLREYDVPVWRLSWSLTGNVLGVSYGIDGVDMWKEMLDGNWVIVNKKQ